MGEGNEVGVEDAAFLEPGADAVGVGEDSSGVGIESVAGAGVLVPRARGNQTGAEDARWEIYSRACAVQRIVWEAYLQRRFKIRKQGIRGCCQARVGRTHGDLVDLEDHTNTKSNNALPLASWRYFEALSYTKQPSPNGTWSRILSIASLSFHLIYFGVGACLTSTRNLSRSHL